MIRGQNELKTGARNITGKKTGEIPRKYRYLSLVDVERVLNEQVGELPEIWGPKSSLVPRVFLSWARSAHFPGVRLCCVHIHSSDSFRGSIWEDGPFDYVLDASEEGA